VLIVTLNRAYRSWTPETVSTFAGHAVVTQTVFDVKCRTRGSPLDRRRPRRARQRAHRVARRAQVGLVERSPDLREAD